MKIPRGVYAALGIAAAAAAIGLVVWQRASWWQLVVFAIAPDISLLIGASSGLERGQLHPRAVPVYNAVHRLAVPVALAIVAGLLQQPAWVAAGLAWIAHIGIDRSLGFGLRNSEGFQRT